MSQGELSKNRQLMYSLKIHTLIDNCEKCPRSVNIASEPGAMEVGIRKKKTSLIVNAIKFTINHMHAHLPVIHNRIPPKDIQPPL